MITPYLFYTVLIRNENTSAVLHDPLHLGINFQEMTFPEYCSLRLTSTL